MQKQDRFLHRELQHMDVVILFIQHACIYADKGTILPWLRSATGSFLVCWFWSQPA